MALIPIYIISSIILIGLLSYSIARAGESPTGKKLDAEPYDSNPPARYGIYRAWVLITLKNSDVSVASLAQSEIPKTICSTPNAGFVILNRKIKDLGGTVFVNNMATYFIDMLDQLKTDQCIAAVLPHKYTDEHNDSSYVRKIAKKINQNYRIAEILTGNKLSPNYVMADSAIIFN